MKAKLRPGRLLEAVKEVEEMEPAQKARRTETIRNPHSCVGRNDPCPCGSGKKYKQCCQDNAAFGRTKGDGNEACCCGNHLAAELSSLKDLYSDTYNSDGDYAVADAERRKLLSVGKENVCSACEEAYALLFEGELA